MPFQIPISGAHPASTKLPCSDSPPRASYRHTKLRPISTQNHHRPKLRPILVPEPDHPFFVFPLPSPLSIPACIACGEIFANQSYPWNHPKTCRALNLSSGAHCPYCIAWFATEHALAEHIDWCEEPPLPPPQSPFRPKLHPIVVAEPVSGDVMIGEPLVSDDLDDSRTFRITMLPAGNCPYCFAWFVSEAELNVHIDWCDEPPHLPSPQIRHYPIRQSSLVPSSPRSTIGCGKLVVGDVCSA